jgi:hypothetical protein
LGFAEQNLIKPGIFKELNYYFAGNGNRTHHGVMPNSFILNNLVLKKSKKDNRQKEFFAKFTL